VVTVLVTVVVTVMTVLPAVQGRDLIVHFVLGL
jgi:hypothetical protein